MRKPNIEIEEFGAMGHDGFEIKIDGEAIATTNRLAFADAYESMINALIDAKVELINNGLSDGNNCHPTLVSINNALTKAGVEL